MSCVFCDIVNKKRNANIVFKNENIICFLDNEPINEGHILIIPKEHYLDIDEIPNHILFEIMDLSKKCVDVIKAKYLPDGYSIMQNGGIFNDVGHYHLHIFPRYKGDGFGWTFGGGVYEHNNGLSEELKQLLSSHS